MKEISGESEVGVYLLNLCLNGISFDKSKNKGLALNGEFFCDDLLTSKLLSGVGSKSVLAEKKSYYETGNWLVATKLTQMSEKALNDENKAKAISVQIKKLAPQLEIAYESFLVKGITSRLDKFNFVKVEDKLKFKKVVNRTAKNCYELSEANCSILKEKVKSKVDESVKIEVEIKSLGSDLKSAVSSF